MIMRFLVFAFGARVSFLFEKQTKPYPQYGAGSIAEEKDAIAQKALQRIQLRWVAVRAGA